MEPGSEETHQILRNTREAASVFEGFVLRCYCLSVSLLCAISASSRQYIFCSALNFEQIQRRSIKLLHGFQQELEKIRRIPLDESSNVVAGILSSNPSSRITRYKEAGCHHVHADQQMFFKLNDFLKGLENHIRQAQEGLAESQKPELLMWNLWSTAQEGLAESQKLVENVTGLMDLDLDLLVGKPRTLPYDEDQKENQIPEPVFMLPKQQSSDYALFMSGILHTMEQDLRMQEMVVSDLRLDMDSDRLQAYCHLWALHPFLDESLFCEASSWVRE